MNWFQRHPNWTIGITWLIWLALAYVCLLASAYYLVGGLILFSGEMFGAGFIPLLIIPLLLIPAWWITGGAIKQKKRSLWHLLWLLLPFIGVIIILLLKNDNQPSWLPPAY
jgi:drug/metabolite transporter (DMT)-like permease